MNDMNTEDDARTFVRIMRHIKDELENSSTEDEALTILRELHDLILDNMDDIVRPLGVEEFFTLLERLFFVWYDNGNHIVAEYYRPFFGDEFPYWAFEEEDEFPYWVVEEDEYMIGTAPTA